MKKVKIILCQDFDGDSYSQIVAREGLSDWEEVSDEDFALLKTSLHRIYPVPYPYSAMLVVQDEVPIIERIASIKKQIAKAEREQQMYQKEREKAKKERQAKRNATKAVKKARTEKEEKELLRDLYNKYGSELANQPEKKQSKKNFLVR